MANLKEVRNRIISVNSTQQITKAMKMVSAAKLKRAVDASSNMVPFARHLEEMISRLSGELGDLQNIYSLERPIKKALIVVVTSNRGLAGAFNSNIIRLTQNYIQDHLLNHLKKEDVLILAIGKKGYEYFKRRGFTIIENQSDIFNSLQFSEVSEIVNRVMQGFVDGKWDTVELFYNRFKNAALQIQEQVHLIPVVKQVENRLPESVDPKKTLGKIEANFTFEPDLESMINYLVPESIRASVYSSLLSSFAAEHGARMTSMDKATENAAELLKAYKLQYNRARQASITNEILEIVSGANALESSGA